MEQKHIPFPYEFEEMTQEEKAENKRLYNYPKIDLIRMGPKGYVMPRAYKEQAESIYNLPIRPSDIYVASYQRAGTTLTQELNFHVLHRMEEGAFGEHPPSGGVEEGEPHKGYGSYDTAGAGETGVDAISEVRQDASTDVLLEPHYSGHS
ncbi:hypothetical protein HF086_017897 [Spodoptera exigua]|uniref:Sulfotransferase n=1 Tax=Spodoptera exigua TaxID=7107 RepID=A0A922MF03_SPOEX|nr:hypothetical protein HF086_017897 [Spodoptera exigua]